MYVAASVLHNSALLRSVGAFEEGLEWFLLIHPNL